MITLNLLESAGSFAENKDLAQSLRLEKIIPALERGEEVVLNFDNVDGTTQSFIHALISDPIRIYGSNVLDRITFKNCTETVQKIISIVVDYMQES
ncbi:MAG TPA: STAS-like domain-containing protein [Candidatus Paceibacterota bacterium]